MRRRTSETFFIGRTVRPRREVALAELNKVLEGEGGLRRLRTALSHELPAGKTDQMSDHEVVVALADGVAAGRFVLIGFEPRSAWAPVMAPAAGPAGDEAKPPPEEKKDEDAWLEIELLDEGNPPMPIPGAKYVVELKDGTLIEGTLNEKGKARLEGIKGATAKVSFPEIDGAEWK